MACDLTRYCSWEMTFIEHILSLISAAKWQSSSVCRLFFQVKNILLSSGLKRLETEANHSLPTEKLENAYGFTYPIPLHLRETVLKDMRGTFVSPDINPLNAELNPICHLLALLGIHHFLHVSRIRVKSLTLSLLMPYIYI